MSDFLSWIEKPSTVKGKPDIYFLTAKQVFHTRKGKLLQKELAGDYIGHSAIRFYYDLPDTIGRHNLFDKESTNFSSPANFPAVIVRAIKRGDFAGMGTPKGLLCQPAWAEYEKIRQQAYAEYEKIRQQALAEYEKIRQPAFWDLFAINENRAEAWK